VLINPFTDCFQWAKLPTLFQKFCNNYQYPKPSFRNVSIWALSSYDILPIIKFIGLTERWSVQNSMRINLQKTKELVVWRPNPRLIVHPIPLDHVKQVRWSLCWTTGYTGWGKIKYPNTKIAISQKCLEIFAPNVAHLFGTILCKCIALCCIYLTNVKLAEMQTSERISQLNKKLILLLKQLSNKYHLCCDVIIFMFTCNIAL